MTATVNEVWLDEVFVKASFADLDLIMHNQFGLINATQLCNSKGKKLASYSESKGKTELKLALDAYYGLSGRWVLRDPTDEPCLAGEYFHPALLLDLAAWLSPETYVHSAVIINSFFNRSDHRRHTLYTLFAIKEIACTYENVPPNHIIRYGDLSLEVNEQAWFKTSDFRCVDGRKLKDFEACKGVASLLKYFRRRGLLNPTHYHPLLLLRFASWVNVHFYVKCARVVFCCDDAGLNWLLRREIAAAGVSKVELAAAPVAPDQSATGERSLLERWLSSQPNFQSHKFSDILFDLNDSDDSSMTTDSMSTTTDLNSEVDPLLMIKQLEMKVDQLEDLLKRERLEKKYALEREQRKEVELARVRMEKRAAEERERMKDDQPEGLQRKLENIQVPRSIPVAIPSRSSHERAWVLSSLSLNSSSDLVVHDHDRSISTITKLLDIDGLECLVLFVSTENVLYGVRRRFNNIIPTIHKQLHKVAVFVGLFVFTDAIPDYYRCETLVSDQATQSDRNVGLPQNRMGPRDQESAKFDFLDALRKMLRVKLDVVEADVRILGRLFNKPTYPEGNVHVAAPQNIAWSIFMEQVYWQIRAEYSRFYENSRTASTKTEKVDLAPPGTEKRSSQGVYTRE